MTLQPPAPPLVTAAEFLTRYENKRTELIKGRPREVPVPQQRHGQICAQFARLLGNHVADNDLGHITTNDPFIVTSRDPDTILAADICYFSYERLPRGPIPEGLLTVVPELVVEVRSPTDRWTEVFAKVVDYLRAGILVVVVLDPGTQTASVYRADFIQQVYPSTDLLVLADVLPGFSVLVQRLFG